MVLFNTQELSNTRVVSAWFFLIWYIVILVVAYCGFFEILQKLRRPPKMAVSDEELEGVTVIRPIKGIDPELYTCLESSFLQNYPSDKLQILFCVDEDVDPSIPILKDLKSKYPHLDVRILISETDSNDGRSVEHYGPNPKVNNLAKGFIESKYDILWIMDSNVWASSNVLRNSVVSLNGNYNNGRKVGAGRPVELVHHVPTALSITSCSNSDSDYILSPTSSHAEHDYRRRLVKKLGAKLDEMFLLTSHSKFYVSLNNVAIAPCVNGKSNIYRKSSLDKAVEMIPGGSSSFFSTNSVISDASYYASMGMGNAIKFFSRYIGEDNMIAIALWENLCSRTALTGDIVIQPLRGSDNSIGDYITRRVRWLRVRRYMVLMATLVEPTTECFLCGIYGTYAVSSLLWNQCFNFRYFAFHVLFWMATDYLQYYTLLGNIALYPSVPSWLSYASIPAITASPFRWAYVWLLRELLAFPIWITAMYGHEINWRGRPFKIKKDLTAEEI